MPGDPSDFDVSPTVVQSLGRGGETQNAGFRLTVTAGPDLQATFLIDDTSPLRVFVGQSPTCEVRLSDREVSRRHAALQRTGEELRLIDLGSTNGTYVDRVKVVEACLRGGETLRLGGTSLWVERVALSGGGSAASGASRFGRLTGESPQMRQLFPLCARLAATSVPVIIEGETGTGKEVLAESLHEEGPRAANPFVVLDCTTVPPNLLESELFGHERGAFTGALSAHKGVFEQAEGGTLLIDEIGDLDLALQPKLLRAIERSEIRRLGGTRWVSVDVRVIAATRRNLDHEIEAGRFRDDLYYRLAVARVELPPLRHRQGDVLALARHFWAELGGNPDAIPEELLVKLQDYEWPGNVRELRNVITRQFALGEFAPQASGPPRADSGASAIADPFERVIAAGLPFPRARDQILDEFVQRYTEHVLAKHGGNVVKAAQASGIGRRYFQVLRAKKTRD